MNLLALMVAGGLAFGGCNNETDLPNPAANLSMNSKVVSTDFIGNGAQWGGYEMASKWLNGQESLSEADWATLFKRIDFMRPPFLRIMFNSGGIAPADYSSAKTKSLFKMLEYAQSRNIEVVFGEWGYAHKGADLLDVDQEWVSNSVQFLDYLIEKKGFSCIKTTNIINEPNGDWSAARSRYDVWLKVQQQYIQAMKKFPALQAVQLTGPDIAVFKDAAAKDWIQRASNDIGKNIGMYDIHAYVGQQFVKSGQYGQMLHEFKEATPAGKKLVLTELGFKYISQEDVDLKNENIKAIENDKFAGDDSNMMVYKPFYGVDMADAIIQGMRQGVSGTLVWSMDDAMYNSPKGNDYNTPELKKWGFWNILGEEHCNDAKDEAIRPFFYPVSLLCRYFPAGSTIYTLDLGAKKGLRAVMAEKDGKYTIAMVNGHYATYELNLLNKKLGGQDMDVYRYQAKFDGSDTFDAPTDKDGFAVPTETNRHFQFNENTPFEIKGQSVVLLTNMK
ncbi:hypothetical protein PEPS_44500 (plasmid) [Persicobacter psychrovividus]|uniref:Glycoside hydrolase family 5 domain-containing protein n=2 Tax=Persicobacter psychrovividus TaxID=387638 RepID=A0ABM7VMD3_9BACT|nr:hypothetical protein PEPS_44500 [Persicobacter psychrovividus]